VLVVEHNAIELSLGFQRPMLPTTIALVEAAGDSLVIFTALVGLVIAASSRSPGAGVHLDSLHRSRRRRVGATEHVVRKRIDALMSRTATGRSRAAGSRARKR